MFVFYIFSQYPVDENKLFRIKTAIKTITFSLEKSYIFLTLWTGANCGCSPPEPMN